MSYLGICRLEFEKIIIFEISNHVFLIMKSFMQKLKYLNLVRKLIHLGMFGLKFENNIMIFKVSNLKFA